MFDHSQIRTIEEVEDFLNVTEVFTVDACCPKAQRVPLLQETLVRFRYQTLGRREQGLLRRYLRCKTGYSPAQLSRHISAHCGGQKLCKVYRRHAFPTRYTNGDRELLAETDNVHGRLNGAATRKICERMAACGDDRFARLAGISVSQLYVLRGGKRYRERALTIEKTKPVQRAIGKRCKPEPDGKTGYLRVDTVHQGDHGGQKGVYHIDFVDEVTQWQVVLAVEGISEQFLLPVLKEALRLFPFRIHNFHSDNGSEFINHQVAGLLKKLVIRQTKTRPRHSNDNGLVESKNGAVIRKHLGYVHIPGMWAPRINQFYREHLIPYLNFHRPCAFPIRTVSANGKVKIVYRAKDYRTPLEQLLSLSVKKRRLRPGMTMKRLQATANARTPNQVVQEMQEAKRILLHLILRHLNDTPESPLHS